jgi:hypothetical protein
MKFLSFNILTSHPRNEKQQSIFEKDIKADCWQERKKLIFREIIKCDVAVLVETTHLQYKSIIDFLNKKGRKFKGRLKLKKNCTDGTAIIYNSEIFIEIGNFSEYLHEKYGTQILLSLVLYDLNKDKEIVISGLHLKSGYKDMEDRRNKEILKAVELINKWLSYNSRTGISQIIAGDFNSEHEKSPSSNYFSKVNDILKNNFDYKNTFEDYENHNLGHKYYPFITYNYYHSSIFDYIYTKRLKSSDLHIDKIDTIIPNSYHGSDHLPILCNLEFN